MKLIPCCVALPEASEERKRARAQSGVFLLANDEDYVGIGYPVVTEAGLAWRLLDGTLLDAARVTQWGHLTDVAYMAKRVEDAELFDDEGDPSEYALARVEEWPWHDSLGWIRLVERLWHFRESGISIEVQPDSSWKADLSTLGWSGNESVLAAMKRNRILWATTWQSARRGGHFVLEHTPTH